MSYRLAVLVSGLLLALTATASAAEFKAGAAKIDITPPNGYAMWGYAARHDRPSVGVLDRLWARALVLEVDGTRLALVSLDLGRAPTRQSTAAIRARTRREAGIEHLMLAASHTHHGPVIELDTWPTPGHSYVRELEGKIAEVILEAARTLRPARLGVASREVDFNRNRHSHRADAPVDRELLVLRIEDLQGQPIAHAVNFAAHATMLPRELYQFSADYPGVLARRVEKETGAPCLFLQGAAGDLTTNSEKGPSPAAFGEALAREALTLARSMRLEAEQEPRLHVEEKDFRFRSRLDHQNPGIQWLFALNFFRELVQFYVREYQDGIRPHLTTALLNGRIGLVGVSGEFFCGHALSLKRRARLEHVLFIGYCNDYQQYFPTIEAAAEGGYGADPQVAPAEVGAGEQVIDRALIQLYGMRGKLPELNPGK